MVAGVEGIEAERVHRARGPEPQRVHVAAAPADDRRVVGHRLDRLGRLPDVADARLGHVHRLHRSPEADLMCDLGAGEFPGVAEVQPVLGVFPLPAVADDLAEQAVVVADAIAEGGDGQRRHAFHEAGGQTAETAIAECGIRLRLAQLLHVDPKRLQRFPERRGEAEVAQVVAEQPPDEEFEAEIVHLLRAGLVRRAGQVDPAVHDVVPHRHGGGDEPVAVARPEPALAEVVGQLLQDGFAQGGGVGGQGRPAGHGPGRRGLVGWLGAGRGRGGRVRRRRVHGPDGSPSGL
jgi:hypothetical protein